MPSVFFLPFLLFDIKPALFFSFLLCLADFFALRFQLLPLGGERLL